MVVLKTTLTTVTLKGKAGSPAERRLNASPKAQKECVRGDTTDGNFSSSSASFPPVCLHVLLSSGERK